MNPIPPVLKKLWNAWDIRALVLLSLILQITLFIFANRRKYIVRTWIRFTVWVAYLMADWVVITALGKLSEPADIDSSNIFSSSANELRTLWAPLLFLHLGGPDTITAYAFEDNKLWSRHFLVVVVQLVQAIYVLLLTWTISWLSFLTFPIFLAGVIKNGERVWALYSSGTAQISLNITNQVQEENLDERKLILAHQSFATFRQYVLNNISPTEDLTDSWKGFTRWRFREAGNLKSLLHEISSMDIVELFDVIEIELGFMFDMIYTKAAITYTKKGCILRLISLICSLSVLLVFFLKEISSHNSHSNIDFGITAVLLVMAVAVELYAITVVLSSDWTMLFIIKHYKNWWASKILKSFPRLIAMHKKKRWSQSMGQFSIPSFCFNYRHPGSWLGKILVYFCSDEMIRWFWHKSFVDVPDHSLKVLFKELLSGPVPITASRGEKALEKLGCGGELKRSCTDPVVFEESIINWHIATEICYHMSSDDLPNEAMRTSKILSDYMMYLLVMHPSMFLPAYREKYRSLKLRCTILALIRCFKEAANVSEACSLLSRRFEDFTILAKSLAADLIRRDNKWDVMQSVWAEMLCYAAIKSEYVEHVQELRHGGEFLTHLWFLLLHRRVASEGVRMLREE